MQARVLCVFVSLCLTGVPGLGFAEEGKPDFALAKRHFKAGQEFLQMERYAEAVTEFKQAYEITRDGLVMGQVAQAYAKAGDFENALSSIKIYREALPAGDRGSADSLIEEYEKAVKDGRSKPLVLAPEKKAEPSKEEEATKPLPPTEEPVRKHKGRLWTWVAAGTAGALALSALVLGLNAQSKFDELSDTCKQTGGCAASEVDSVKTRALVTDVLWGTAALAGITAGVLYFVEGRSKSEKVDTPSETEEEPVSRRLHFAPVVGSGRLGLSAGVTF